MKAEEVINNLINLYRENRLSHAYLIETNHIEKCILDVKKIIKGMSCVHGKIDNCNECNLCNLIDNNNLPSLIILEPDGKYIKKDSVDDLKKRFSTTPIYTKNNMYIVISPENMNDASFNRMLKFLEEPEENIIGFFITMNKDNVADTILSRCEILKIIYQLEDDIIYDDNLNSSEYLNVLKDSSNNILWYNNTVLLKQLETRNDAVLFLKSILKKSLNNYITTKNIEDKKIANIVNKYLEQLNYNVNLSLLFNSLAIEIGEVYER